jgi:hypothetical protein
MIVHVDFSLADFGTVWLLTPITASANEWASANLPENFLRWGGGIAIDHRLIDDLVDAIGAVGLCVEGAALEGRHGIPPAGHSPSIPEAASRRKVSA